MWIDDEVLVRAQEAVATQIFIPKTTAVVLGRSNQAAIEVNQEYCQQSEIPVLQRRGGGGTVVLYPGCIVISLGCWVSHRFQNDRYFRMINQSLIDCLAGFDPKFKELDQNGISDICFQNKKVAGTSLFRSRNYLLYQASLIVDLDLELISKALQHPSKEPDYRENRAHGEFLVGLSDLTQAPIGEVLQHCKSQFGTHLNHTLKADLTEPYQDQISHVFSRASQVAT